MEQFDPFTYITFSSELDDRLSVVSDRLSEEPRLIPWVMQEEGEA